MTETTKAAAGQVWEDTYDYGTNYHPTLEITEADTFPGGFAYGVRRPSNRKTRIRLDAHCSIPGYRLKTTPEGPDTGKEST